jgi:hypothetical protein
VVKTASAPGPAPSRSARWSLVAALILALTLLPGRQAAAHPEFVPTLVNRYISVTVFETRVEVLASLLFGQLPAGERRRQMDRDHSGRIEARELARERAFWSGDIDKVVRFLVDGAPVALTTAAVVDLNGDPAVAPRPMLVTLHSSFPLPPGQRALRVEGRADLPRLGETEIALDIVAGWNLVASQDGAGRATASPQRLFQFSPAASGPATTSSLTYVLQASAGSRPPRFVWGAAAWGLLAGATAALAGVVWLAWRARRRQAADG